MGPTQKACRHVAITFAILNEDFGTVAQLVAETLFDIVAIDLRSPIACSGPSRSVRQTHS